MLQARSPDGLRFPPDKGWDRPRYPAPNGASPGLPERESIWPLEAKIA